MPLVPMHTLLYDAQKHHYAVIASNLLTLEMIRGGIQAAEACHSPLILQLAPVQFDTAPLALLGPLMVAAAKQASVPVAVHLDHGFDVSVIEEALNIGFSSVMVDASMHPFENNVAYTQAVVKKAHPFGATVEAELGHVGEETTDADANAQQRTVGLTNPDEALAFVNATGCHALAVAIGNAHGLYQTTPKLDIARLKKIQQHVSHPLVLHGGSGTSDADFQASIQAGVTKINMASAVHKTYIDAMLGLKTHHYLTVSQTLEQAVRTIITRYMTLFGSVGKASEILK